MGGDVVVVGDLLVDVVIVPSGPPVRGSDVDSTVRVLGGGSAANTACWLAHEGAGVRLVAGVGDDLLGHAALEELRERGVAWAGHVAASAATGACAVVVEPDGERTMYPDRGASDQLSEAAVLAAIADTPAWVHLSGYALLGEQSRGAGRAALAAARRSRVPTSVDASSAEPLRRAGSATFLEWIAGADVLFANDDEVEALGGIAAIRAAVGTVVAKHGARGASWHRGPTTRSRPSLADRVVDSVGAGDAFDAGWINASVDGADEDAALDAAQVVAAKALGVVGGRPATR